MHRKEQTASAGIFARPRAPRPMAMVEHHSRRFVMRSPRPLGVDRRRFLSGSLAVAASLPVLGRHSFAQAPQVNVYNWDTYIGETRLEDFTDATGIAVR